MCVCVVGRNRIGGRRHESTEHNHCTYTFKPGARNHPEINETVNQRINTSFLIRQCNFLFMKSISPSFVILIGLH